MQRCCSGVEAVDRLLLTKGEERGSLLDYFLSNFSTSVSRLINHALTFNLYGILINENKTVQYHSILYVL